MPDAAEAVLARFFNGVYELGENISINQVCLNICSEVIPEIDIQEIKEYLNGNFDKCDIINNSKRIFCVCFETDTSSVTIFSG